MNTIKCFCKRFAHSFFFYLISQLERRNVGRVYLLFAAIETFTKTISKKENIYGPDIQIDDKIIFLFFFLARFLCVTALNVLEHTVETMLALNSQKFTGLC